MSHATKHILAQADAIKRQADEAMADYARQFGDMTEYARRWLETVCGDTSRNPDLIPGVETRAYDPAEVFDRADDEAQREEAGD